MESRQTLITGIEEFYTELPYALVRHIVRASLYIVHSEQLF